MRKDNFQMSERVRNLLESRHGVDRPLKEMKMVYLQISLDIAANDRPAAAAIYTRFKSQFLLEAKGAKSKELLIRDEDVQVLHAFDSAENAKAYLASALFNEDVATALKPLLQSSPDVRVYAAA